MTHHLKRRVVSSRTFLSLEEFLAMNLQEIKELPDGHFILKAPHHPAVVLRAPFVRTPRIGAKQRTEALARVYRQACYSTPAAIEAEESERNVKLLEAAVPQPVIDAEEDVPVPTRRAARRRR